MLKFLPRPRLLSLSCALIPLACLPPGDRDAGSKADAATAPLVCVWNDTEEPAFLPSIGCPADFAALGAVPLDSSLPGATTVKYLVDRASVEPPASGESCTADCPMPQVCGSVQGNTQCTRYQVYFQNTKQRALHFYYARDYLNGTCQCKEACRDSCDCDVDSSCSENCRCDTDCACPCGEPERLCSLPPVSDLATFNATEYIMPSRRFLLGSITHFESSDIYALNLAPVDTASAEMIERMFRLVAASAYFGPKLRFLPGSLTQEQLARELPSDIRTVTTAEIYAGLTFQPLNLGETIGQVKILRSRDLDEIYLSPRDIAVLDTVPNDINPVAGIITAEFQTPLSHINVLSQNRGTPNMGLLKANRNSQIRAVEGRWARLTVGANSWSIEEVTAEVAEQWWRDRQPPVLEIPPIDTSVQTLQSMEQLTIDDVMAVGAKAANYGSLQQVRQVIKRYDFERSSDLGSLPNDWSNALGTWQVVEETQATSGRKVVAAAINSGTPQVAIHNKTWRNFDCSSHMAASADGAMGLVFLYNNDKDYHVLQIDRGQLRLDHQFYDKRFTLDSAPYAATSTWHHLAVRVHDRAITAQVSTLQGTHNTELFSHIVNQPAINSCGLFSSATAGAQADEFEITPIYNPRAFAIPFFFYRQFMEQNGLDDRFQALLDDPQFRSDGNLRQESLKELRDAIVAAPVDAAFRQMLEDKLRTEFPNQRMRFRSSTNAEDLGSYSGAGLYTSRSGQLDDPERPVLEAVKKVWASLFNMRAYEEREIMGIDHHDVAMAVLVHRSFPNEMANGVSITANLFDVSEPAFYINVQVGEESVTNPEPGILPDQFLYYWAGINPATLYLSYSTLNHGQPVMSRREIHELASAMLNIHRHFQPHFGARDFYAMELEFKLDVPDRNLVIKQARPFPGRGQ